MKRRTIDVQSVREYFEYADGQALWKKQKGSQGKPGQRFGSWNYHTGYRQGQFDNRGTKEHQIVWLLFNDELPETIDHIDGDRGNNRIENLRAATQSQNLMNMRTRQNNTGHKGVWYWKERGVYCVSVTVRGRAVKLGNYKDFELACLVADEARDLYHGEFARNK